MSATREVSVEISKPYPFSRDGLAVLEQNRWVKNQWPLVYFIENEAAAGTRIGYIGESTHALSRIRNHLGNSQKNSLLTQVSIIASERFNKSATLDIESSLIQYVTAEGTYQLLNGNYGLSNHRYYEQDLYKGLFRQLWSQLRKRKIVNRSLTEIENSQLFKYSPYKSLNEDQYRSVLEILEGLTTRQSNRIFVRGSAGTGKTILATYLVKLLRSDVGAEDDADDEALEEVRYIRQFQTAYPNARIGMVVAMKSLRKTLKNVFEKIPGLKASMVMSPSETFNLGEKYDLLIADEAHRLRQYRNISWAGAFRKNNQKLGLDPSVNSGLANPGTELDWILANSKNQLFFYDPDQSIRPSDVEEARFTALLNEQHVIRLSLHSQMRVQGGSDYLRFVDDLLHLKRTDPEPYKSTGYDLMLFDSLPDLCAVLAEKEQEHRLCRLVAGYAWPWASKENKKAVDIEIDGMQFQWNQVDEDWINSPTAAREIGCIHTTMGYDLNYTGVIFGREIRYNPATHSIEIAPEHYHDANGKKSIRDPEALKSYIINIYKNMMYRGIRGTYVYACDAALREYLKQHIPAYREVQPFRFLSPEEALESHRAVPFADIYAAAGTFSELQLHEVSQWIELPFDVADRDRYFVCQVIGESMNKVIPNDAYCLFRRDEGGTRNGKIVLAQSTRFPDAEFGSGYTVKRYRSAKSSNAETWGHDSITLYPESDDPAHKPIELLKDEAVDFKVIGVFERVI
ncbi:hypothetical protein GCM10023091_16260 [Ravibacter arvi]|uniref:GIY-YIG domain-containing protein n=1 Tax=Ravibacter arvi TaxID=2051041 RepID=A0ABP8LWB8_9BACT